MPIKSKSTKINFETFSVVWAYFLFLPCFICQNKQFLSVTIFFLFIFKHLNSIAFTSTCFIQMKKFEHVQGFSFAQTEDEHVSQITSYTNLNSI